MSKALYAFVDYVDMLKSLKEHMNVIRYFVENLVTDDPLKNALFFQEIGVHAVNEKIENMQKEVTRLNEELTEKMKKVLSEHLHWDAINSSTYLLDMQTPKLVEYTLFLRDVSIPLRSLLPLSKYIDEIMGAIHEDTNWDESLGDVVYSDMRNLVTLDFLHSLDVDKLIDLYEGTEEINLSIADQSDEDKMIWAGDVLGNYLTDVVILHMEHIYK